MKQYRCTTCGSKNLFLKKLGRNIILYCDDCGTWLNWNMVKKERPLVKEKEGNRMRKAELNFPSKKWIPGNNGERPKDKQICVIITTGRDIRVCQYRRNMHGMSELFHNLNMPTYFSWSSVECWQPIDLPDDVEKRIL